MSLLIRGGFSGNSRVPLFLIFYFRRRFSFDISYLINWVTSISFPASQQEGALEATETGLSSSTNVQIFFSSPTLGRPRVLCAD